MARLRIHNVICFFKDTCHISNATALCAIRQQHLVKEGDKPDLEAFKLYAWTLDLEMPTGTDEEKLEKLEAWAPIVRDRVIGLLQTCAQVLGSDFSYTAE